MGSHNSNSHQALISDIEDYINRKKQEPRVVFGEIDKLYHSTNKIKIRLHQTDNRLRVGNSIIINDVVDNKWINEYTAEIKDISGLIVEVELTEEDITFESNKLAIDVNTNNVILSRLGRVINDIKQEKISDDMRKNLTYLNGGDAPSYILDQVHEISPQLNNEQHEAVQKSLTAEAFHLIIGPPGTGKTFVIEELIKILVRNNNNILITAWTNLAIDNIVKRLDSGGIESKIVRIGPLNATDPDVRRHSIHNLMKAHPSWKEIEKSEETINAFYKAMYKHKNDLNAIRTEIYQEKRSVDYLKECKEALHKDIRRIEANKAELVFTESTRDPKHELDKQIDWAEKIHDSVILLTNLKLIESKLPSADEISNLKREIRKMRLKIIMKRFSSLISTVSKLDLKKLLERKALLNRQQDNYEQIQNQYVVLEKQWSQTQNEIKELGDKGLNVLYLETEINLYQYIVKHYIPFFRKHHKNKANNRMTEISRGVYDSCLVAINSNIAKMSSEIKWHNTNLYALINQKEELINQIQNLQNTINLYKKNINKLKRTISYEIIMDSSMIAATSASSCHNQLDEVVFDVMIMDEASQVASFMSLMPLSKCKRFILVGDDKQLQPIAEESLSDEHNLSVFNKLLNNYHANSTLLKRQYRMNEMIAHVSNTIFYDGNIETSEIAAKRILDLDTGVNPILNPEKPLVLLNTAKSDYYEDEVGTGCSNQKEAELVVELVSSFLNEGIKPEAIGVITPFIRQRNKINELLDILSIENIKVNTVHRFQGREMDIIIFSFARSKKYGCSPMKLKFISNETLINVAITTQV